MAVNITNVTAMNTLADMGKFANDASGGIFWGVVMTALFIIILFNTLKQGVARAAASACFSCLLIALPLFYLAWLHIVYVIVFAVGLASTLAVLFFEDRKGR